MSTEEKIQRPLRVVKYNEEYVSLVIWSLQRGNRTHPSKPSDLDIIGNLIMKRVEDTPNEEVAKMDLELQILHWLLQEKKRN